MGHSQSLCRAEGTWAPTRRAHGDQEEQEPNWELLPLPGDTVLAGNSPPQHSRPGQANLGLRVPQK